MTDRDRLHRDRGVDRGLQQRRVERSELTAVGRRAFGKTTIRSPVTSSLASRFFTRIASRR
jgi:hypothetical protein